MNIPEIFTAVRHRGVLYRLNGRDYVVPSLSLAQVQEFEEQLSQVTAVDLKDPKSGSRLIALYLPLIGAAFRRNYPDVTDQQLLEWIDTMQFGEIVTIVQNASGYTRVDRVGEPAPTGPTGALSSAD